MAGKLLCTRISACYGNGVNCTAICTFRRAQYHLRHGKNTGNDSRECYTVKYELGSQHYDLHLFDDRKGEPSTPTPLSPRHPSRRFYYSTWPIPGSLSRVRALVSK